MSRSEDGTREHWASDCKEYLDQLVGEDTKITSFSKMSKFDLKKLAYFLAEAKRQSDAIKAAFSAAKERERKIFMNEPDS